ncbi:MAG: 50S ribosomal protein L25/general stress protein Ctc [Flavobacteriaceae bacterium]
MKSITINGSKREIVGKSSTKALRNAGKVPCVVYGGDKPIHFSADELSFSKLVYTPDAHTAVIELEDGNKIDAIIQDIQFHPVNEKILHIDFFQVFDDKEVKMIIPVKFEGNSPGVRLQGGILSKNKRKLFVKAVPKNLPDFIKADVSTLNLNDKITIEELKDENYSFIHPDNMVVCQVKMSRASMSLETETDEEEGEEGEEGSAESDSKAEGSTEPNEAKGEKKENS